MAGQTQAARPTAARQDELQQICHVYRASYEAYGSLCV